MGRFARTALMIMAIAGIALVFGSVRIAGAAPTTAGPHPIDVPAPIVHPIGNPSAQPNPAVKPVSPFRTSPSPSPAPFGDAVLRANVSRSWFVDRSLARPKNAPKLSQFLVKTGRNAWGVKKMVPVAPMGVKRLTQGRIGPLSANGGTIILTGDQSNYFMNDITLEYGADVYLACQNMPKTNYNNYVYVVFPPDGSAAQTNGTRTDGNGDCTSYGNFNLSTPWGNFGNGGTENGQAYPGVWIIAMEDTGAGNALVSETAIIANAALNFTTYANLGLTSPSYDFTPGSQIVVNATGLNAAHNYALGWVLTAGSGLPCEFTIPGPSTASNGVCFRGATTGLQAFGNQLTQFWGPTSAPSTNTAPTGTYDVELYDTTTSEMISHQQISVEPNTVSWTLTPYNSSGATPPPTLNYNNIFATDGITDQSVTGLTYATAGLPITSNGHTLTLSISDPNGVVLTNPVSYGAYPITAANPTTIQTPIGGSSKQVAFPLNVQYETAYGPTQTPFAPNVFTAQLFDQTLGTVIASKSFQILGYNANIAWSTNTILNAGVGGTTGTVVITNTGGSNFGPWNGDAISGVQIASIPANGESLSLSSLTAVDSAGNGWTITSQGAGVNTVIIATPNQRNVGIPVGGTLQFNVTVTVPAGDCTQPCNLPTQILPEHGIAYSAADAASQSLEVLATGINPSSVVPTLSWAVQSETATANMAARHTKFGQLAYILGTANAPSSDTYNINLTLNNVVSAGGNNLTEVKLTFPAAVDLNANPPTIVTSPAGTGTWKVITNSAGGGALNGQGQNVIALACRETTPNTCGIAQGSSGVFSINFPIFTTSFTETDIAAVANFDKGQAYNNGGCGGCNMAAYNLGATQTTVNGIAGLTNIDSSMLGAFSLNPTLMNMVFQPSTVGTGSATSATLSFTNTPTSRDPNPDYVDQINLIFPAAANPTSITGLPVGWQALQTSADHWQIALCAAPTNANPCSLNETTAIAPGGQLQMTMNYNSPGPAAGTYNVTWYATGANGGENTSAIATTTPITFSTTTASVAFTTINGAAVPNGTEPQVGTDTSLSGSAFQYTVTNTGSTNIDTVVVTLPHLTRSGSAAKDGATGNAGYLNVTAAPTLTYANGAKNCTIAFTNPTAASDGNITLTGCTIPANGGAVAINFNAQTPYLIGNELVFPTNVKSGATQVAAQSTYTASNVLSIILNGTLSILTPSLGWVAPTQPNSVVPAAGSGAHPSTSCVSCQVFAGAPSVIDFGIFNGTFNGGDVVDASVWSDANSPNSWVLYVTTAPGPNPSNMLASLVDVATSSATAGFTVNTSTMTTVGTTTPGTQLDTYTGNPYHKPIDSIMSYQVSTGGNTSPETVTLTYTLVFN